MDLPQRFRAFAADKNLFPADAKILAAVSGGMDSVTLAHLLAAIGMPFDMAHCNFKLRDFESDADEAFVQGLAQKLGVRCFSKTFDTAVFARENGLSIQMAARDLRYGWFEELRREHGFSAIATAHNLDDSVETTVLNLVRGTGLAGLTGIPLRNGHVVRPLLFAQRAEIEAFARAGGIEWREDSSNEKDDYSRNFVRHQILPLLKVLNPGVLQTVGRMHERLAGAGANLDFLSDRFFGEIKTLPMHRDRLEDFGGKISASGEDTRFVNFSKVDKSDTPETPEQFTTQIIDKQQLATLPAPETFLFARLRPLGFTEEQTRQLAAGMAENTGLELRSPAGHRLLNDREKILLTGPPPPPAPIQIQADDLMVSLPDGSRLVLLPAPAAPPWPDGRAQILADASKIHFPLTLRNWLPGDAFQPFSMGGRSQKLQDFFTNGKLGRLEKERVWVLENGGGEIIWVLGHRPDERFRISPETENALKINWLPSQS